MIMFIFGHGYQLTYHVSISSTNRKNASYALCPMVKGNRFYQHKIPIVMYLSSFDQNAFLVFFIIFRHLDKDLI